MSLVAQRLQQVLAARVSGDRHALRTAVGALHAALLAEPVQDALLAASCLAEVQDEGLRTELAQVAAHVKPRQARASALVVDEEGRGKLVQVVVALVPGRTGVWTPMPVERDADVAAQLAAAVVLGPEAPRWSVRWQLDDPTVVLHGTSIGLAMAVATAAALRQREVPQGWAFTGGVDLDGAVASVSGLPAKLRAAREAGLARVAVPTSSTVAGVPEGLEVVRVTRVEALLAQLGLVSAVVAPRSRQVPVAAAVLLPPLLTFAGLLEPVDGLLYDAVAAVAVAPLAADHTAVLTLPAVSDLRELRLLYPAMIDAFVEVGATAIVFDLVFTAEDPADQAFAEAVGRALAASVPVVVGARMEEGAWDGPGSAALAAVVWRGIVTCEHDLLTGRVRRVPVRDRGHAGEPGWHLAVQALRAHLGASEPKVAGGEIAVGITRNAIEVERVWLPPVQAPPHLSWEDRDGWGVAKERVVFVGVGGGARDWFRTPSGALYGAELHATTTEVLARQGALRRWSLGAQAVGSLVLGLVTMGLRTRVPHRLGWVGAVPGAAAGVTGLVAMSAGYLPGVTALMVAVAVGIWAGARLRAPA
jgi:hypothetical protein